MADPRHEKFAKVLVHYSLEIKPGENFVIYGNTESEPLIREVYREALRAGAYPVVRIGIDSLTNILFREANDTQLGYVSELEMFEQEFFSAALHITSPFNTKSMSRVEPHKIQQRQKPRQILEQRMFERTATKDLRWCVTQFPNNASAQDAGMSLIDYEDFVYGAVALDLDDPVAHWINVRNEQQRILEFLSKHDEIHITAPGTDITYRVKGRTWMNAAGNFNVPDGEVFTGPIEESVNGYVTFSYPAVYIANEVENVRLTFENGTVIEEAADRGYDFLKTMLDSDPGARRLGEVAFGLNYGIRQFSKNILFDEKIGGTMHMALGASYPETGGTNQSAIHWDMICDLHKGQVYADGELCYEAGKFII